MMWWVVAANSMLIAVLAWLTTRLARLVLSNTERIHRRESP